MTHFDLTSVVGECCLFCRRSLRNELAVYWDIPTGDAVVLTCAKDAIHLATHVRPLGRHEWWVYVDRDGDMTGLMFGSPNQNSNDLLERSYGTWQEYFEATDDY